MEQVAETAQQRDRAVRATAMLLLAATQAGWRLVELAPALGISASAVSTRVRKARAAGLHHAGGLTVDEPAHARGPLAELARPLDERDWLTRAEAAALLGVADRTVQDYFTSGLLPNARLLARTWRVYLRADLERIRRAPRRGCYLDRAGLRRRIAGTQDDDGTGVTAE